MLFPFVLYKEDLLQQHRLAQATGTASSHAAELYGDERCGNESLSKQLGGLAWRCQ